MIISARAANPSLIQVEITLRAKVEEWNALRELILEQKAAKHPAVVDKRDGGTSEPFWDLLYRLDDIINKVTKQHIDYD